MYYIAGFARHTDLEHFSKRYDDAFGESPELSSVLMSKGGTIGNACVHRRMDQYRLLSCQAKKGGGGVKGYIPLSTNTLMPVAMTSPASLRFVLTPVVSQYVSALSLT